MASWTDSNDKLLIKLYVDDKLDFLSICNKLERKCKDISQRLIDLKIVTHKKNIRGYNNISNRSTNSIIQDYTNLKKPTDDLRSTTNIIFNQIDNIYQVFNNISSIYSNISNITTKEKI